MTHKTSSLVTDAMARQYREEGWFVLERALSDDQLELLRGFAQTAIRRADIEMDTAGVDRLALNHRGRRYFVSGLAKQEPLLRSFLFGDLMGEICRATLGPDAFQFVEQFVIKGADRDSAFSWHQDSGYVHEDHEPYLTCWIALDDVTEENGSVYLLPYSRAGVRSYVKHFHDEATNDKVGYFGNDPRHSPGCSGRKHRLLLECRLPPQRAQPDPGSTPRVPGAVLLRSDQDQGRLPGLGGLRGVPPGRRTRWTVSRDSGARLGLNCGQVPWG